MNSQALVDQIRSQLPNTRAVYLFGSRATGNDTKNSDYDLAVYIPGGVDVTSLWDTAQALSINLDQNVDLIDISAASTVMQFQIISKAKKLWGQGEEIDTFETYVLREKLELDARRAAQLNEIMETGKVYGKRYSGK